MLNVLKDGKGGYTWRETSRKKRSGHMESSARLPKRIFLMTAIKHGVAYKSYSKRVSSDAAVEEEFLSKRSEKYKTVTKSLTDRADKRTHSLWQRLYDVVYKGYMPRGFTLSDKETWRILGLASLIMFKVYMLTELPALDATCNCFGKLKIKFRLSLVAGYLLPYVSGCVRCNYDPRSGLSTSNGVDD